jgi:pimeloyl-ACP methyl ester carboxylesterase
MSVHRRHRSHVIVGGCSVVPVLQSRLADAHPCPCNSRWQLIAGHAAFLERTEEFAADESIC